MNVARGCLDVSRKGPQGALVDFLPVSGNARYAYSLEQQKKDCRHEKRKRETSLHDDKWKKEMKISWTNGLRLVFAPSFSFGFVSSLQNL